MDVARYVACCTNHLRYVPKCPPGPARGADDRRPNCADDPLDAAGLGARERLGRPAEIGGLLTPKRAIRGTLKMIFNTMIMLAMLAMANRPVKKTLHHANT